MLMICSINSICPWGFFSAAQVVFFHLAFLLKDDAQTQTSVPLRAQAVPSEIRPLLLLSHVPLLLVHTDIQTIDFLSFSELLWFLRSFPNYHCLVSNSPFNRYALRSFLSPWANPLVFLNEFYFPCLKIFILEIFLSALIHSHIQTGTWSSSGLLMQRWAAQKTKTSFLLASSLSFSDGQRTSGKWRVLSTRDFSAHSAFTLKWFHNSPYFPS